MEHKYSNDSSEQTIESYQEQIDSCTVIVEAVGEEELPAKVSFVSPTP